MLGRRSQRYRSGLTVAVPEGWFAKDSVTLLAPDGQANVIASTEPLDPGIDVHQYARVQGDLLRHEFPGYVEHSFTPETILGNRAGYLRRFQWTPPDGVPVLQVQLYAVEPGRGITATATTPTTQAERFVEMFEAVLSSVRFLGLGQEQPLAEGNPNGGNGSGVLSASAAETAHLSAPPAREPTIGAAPTAVADAAEESQGESRPSEEADEELLALAERVYRWDGPKMGRTLFNAKLGRLVLTTTRLLFLSTGGSGVGRRTAAAALGPAPAMRAGKTAHLDLSALANPGSASVPLTRVRRCEMNKRALSVAFVDEQGAERAFAVAAQHGMPQGEQWVRTINEARAAIGTDR